MLDEKMRINMKGYLYKVINNEDNDLFANILRILFLPLSLIYANLLRIQDKAYKYKLFKPKAIDVPVISVGNITWGGTGKTPLVILLAKFLSENGKRVAILSRGYKRQSTIDNRQSTIDKYKIMGDEPALLEEKLPNIPVLVGRDRIKNARKALKQFGCDCLLLDDAFQHRRIRRDLDIVLIDVLNPFGNGYCVPRGSLREPIQSLKRADIIILTNYDIKREIEAKLLFDITGINKKALIGCATYRFVRLYDIASSQNLDSRQLVNKSISLLASIGNFTSFKRSIANYIGAKVKLEFDFPDHYDYSRRDLLNIKECCHKENVDIIITTEKDAIRLRPHLRDYLEIKILIFEAELEIVRNKNRFFKKINDVCIS